ncbi:MAG: PH domain-containing protein [Pyrinomonadaceae bacterium]|nr:PH domain-containing protein [Phycisphaerales bacterium]
MTDARDQTSALESGHEVRPLPALMTYYVILSLLTGPGFPFFLVASYFRYFTLRYRFDADEDGGVWMAHGILFKKEVNLTYRRIQDIHVSRNIIQRWLGLATVSVQTASGSATPEVIIEGMADPDAIRDFLYQRMRGARGHGAITQSGDPAMPGRDSSSAIAGADDDDALAPLRDIRDSMATIRNRLADSNPNGTQHRSGVEGGRR